MGPDLGVRACVRTLSPPNPGIYHGNSQRPRLQTCWSLPLNDIITYGLYSWRERDPARTLLNITTEVCINTRSAITGISMLAALLSSCAGEITPTPLSANESMPEKSALSSAALFLDGASLAPV